MEEKEVRGLDENRGEKCLKAEQKAKKEATESLGQRQANENGKPHHDYADSLYSPQPKPSDAQVNGAAANSAPTANFPSLATAISKASPKKRVW